MYVPETLIFFALNPGRTLGFTPVAPSIAVDAIVNALGHGRLVEFIHAADQAPHNGKPR